MCIVDHIGVKVQSSGNTTLVLYITKHTFRCVLKQNCLAKCYTDTTLLVLWIRKLLVMSLDDSLHLIGHKSVMFMPCSLPYLFHVRFDTPRLHSHNNQS